MSRMQAVAAEAQAPQRNDLLDTLDAKLRDRAKAIVKAALDPAEAETVQSIHKANSHIGGGPFRGEVVRRVSDAFDRIRTDAAEIAYRDLVRRVTDQLADGETVDLT